MATRGCLLWLKKALLTVPYFLSLSNSEQQFTKQWETLLWLCGLFMKPMLRRRAVILPYDPAAASCSRLWKAERRCRWSRWWRCFGSIRTFWGRRSRFGPLRPPWKPCRRSFSWGRWPCPGRGRCRTLEDLEECGLPEGKRYRILLHVFKFYQPSKISRKQQTSGRRVLN